LLGRLRRLLKAAESCLSTTETIAHLAAAQLTFRQLAQFLDSFPGVGQRNGGWRTADQRRC